MSDIDGFNDDNGGDGKDGLEEVRDLIRSRGVRAAFNALVEVCENKQAAAPARSSAGTSLFRAAGLFDRAEGGAGKELHEMTGAELRQEIQRMEAKQAAMTRERADETRPIVEGGVFD
ncbi:hypothetical protein [Hoeflea sp.]|uniref:hypothetical protein n=1 Tax=Hoeflea sp. TaxID=1940281 RepID=UPI003A911399